MTPLTLHAVLGRQAREHSDRAAFVHLENGETESARCTYGELDERARRIGAWLRERTAPGDRALLLYPQGLEYVAALFGCFHAGVTAVPAPPPESVRPERSLRRIRALLGDSHPRLALTEGSVVDQCRDQDLGIVGTATDRLDLPAAPPWDRFPVSGEDSIAYLQYTSGSTSDPKGVVIRHRNALANMVAFEEKTGCPPGSVMVSWLPNYHDLGLAGHVLFAIHLAGTCVLFPAPAFIQKPVRWLRALSRYRGGYSAAPNFAYDLSVARTQAADTAGLDLSGWHCAANGAEPARPETYHRFLAAFAPCGFAPSAFHHLFGLSEATGVVLGRGPTDRQVLRSFDTERLRAHHAVPVPDGTFGARTLLGLGTAARGSRAIIADPATARALPPRAVGELWTAGPSVGGGYWGRPEAAAHTFEARLADGGEGPFLRTGDLAFVDEDGEFFLTGRLKDLLIFRGMNYYPQDVESSAEQSHPDVKPGGTAAFQVEGEQGEELVLVCEVRGSSTDTGTIVRAVSGRILDDHGQALHSLALIRERTLPKTTSGKVQRGVCRDLYLSGGLDEVFRWSHRSKHGPAMPKGPPEKRSGRG